MRLIMSLSGSMEPTLLVGDYLIANRLSYVVKVPFTDIVVLTLGEPERGDIIILPLPKDRSKDFVNGSSQNREMLWR